MRIYPRSYEGSALPEFGLDANVIKSKTFDLTNARHLADYELGGNLIWIAEASSRTAYIDVRLNDQLRDPIRVRLGLFIRGVPFSRMFISHPAQPGDYVTILYATAGVDNINIENPSLRFSQVTIAVPSVIQTIADVTALAAATTIILAQNANRSEAILSNLIGGGTLRFGDANAAAARGTPVVTGDTIILTTTAAIYAYNPGVNQDVGVTWIEQ